jgi:hypothetical protein
MLPVCFASKALLFYRADIMVIPLIMIISRNRIHI